MTRAGWQYVVMSNRETITPATGPEQVPTLAQARLIIASLNPGDSVRITLDGRAHDVTVQRREGLDVYRHPDSRAVTVGYGPGRWNTEISADRIAAGYVGVEALS